MIHSDLKRFCLFVFTVAFGLFSVTDSARAGGRFGGQQAVGGVVVDAAGVVRAATLEDRQQMANALQNANRALPGDLQKKAEMRMISLKGLQAAVAESKQSGKDIPSEVRFLAGLQRIAYVFVDQENQDVILAGPAEPWEMREDGFVVGKISGQATMRLEDLTVALRSVENARQNGITCSIEPTDEGRLRLQQLLRRIKLRPGQSPVAFEAAMREAFGPQMIYLSGVPNNSRFARTLVAADFEMKRVAMGLTESKVATLPSYLEMSRNSQQTKNQNPRWWMACSYDALGKSQDGLAWKLSGQGVETKTEQDIVNDDGSTRRGGVDKMAQAWANKMTDSYEDLSKKMPVFSELQNMMDLTVVATLIVQERLAEKAGLSLAGFAEESQSVELASFNTPKAVEPHCSFIKGRSGWVVTASGGVDINGFEVVQNQVADASGSKVREDALAASTGKTWWWNK